MARSVAAGPASFSVTVRCTNSFVIGAYFWLFLRIDSSAPHWARVMTGGSVALGFGFDVVVVVEDREPLVVVVVEDDDEDGVVEALSALRPLPDPPLVPPPSPPSDWGAVVDVDDAAGVAVATRWRRGPLIVSMAMISTWRASPASRTWAWVAPRAKISSDRTRPPVPVSRSWSARMRPHPPQTPSEPHRWMST